MACVVNLYDSLGFPKTTGGNWFYTGVSPLDLAYSICPNPVGASATYNTNDPIGTGYNICVELTAPVTAGNYEFTYVVPDPSTPLDCNTGCVGCAVLTIEVSVGPEDGPPVSICQGDPDQNLYDLLGNALDNPSIDGVWSVDPVVPNGINDGGTPNDGSDDTFDPSDYTPGVYVFTYTVDSSAPCDDCVATVTVTITALPDAGAESEASICV